MKILQTINILSFVAVIAVNTLASTVGINGRLTGAISDGIPNLFVPAGLTFSIWGVIYLLLLLFIFGRKKCPECGKRNPPLAKKCRKCGHILRGRRHEGRGEGRKEHEKKE